MEQKCAFSQTLIGDVFGCEHAEHVVRRGGAEIACRAAEAAARCAVLLQHFKHHALPAFGVDDDLLSMPHSVLVKIQFGGLLGAQRLIDPAKTGAERVDNVNQLVTQTLNTYGDLDEFPGALIVDDMTAYKPRRRGRS